VLAQRRPAHVRQPVRRIRPHQRTTANAATVNRRQPTQVTDVETAFPRQVPVHTPTLGRQLQQDASTPYATLGEAVGLSGAAAHERVRELRDRGVIRRTTIDIDPEAVLLKIRATSTQDLQSVLKRIYDIPGVTGTQTTVVLETFFELPLDPHE
jgi:Lrp/AsnC family leucine-responsive transcriptional regulator